MQGQHLMHRKVRRLNHVRQSSTRRPLKTETLIWLHVRLFTQENEKISAASKRKVVGELLQATGAVFS